MPTTTALSAGGSISISLAAGSSLSAYGMGTMQIAPPVPVYLDAALRTLSPNEQRIGPFAAAVTVNLTAVAGGSGVSYYTLAPTDVVLPGANAPSGATLTAAQTAATQALVLGARSPAVGGVLSLFGAQQNTAGAGFTFLAQHPALAPFYGSRAVYVNYAAAQTITRACSAPAPTNRNNGNALTWVARTFDGGLTAGSQPAGSGSGANIVPSIYVSDWLEVPGVARSDTPTSNQLILERAYYAAGSSQRIVPANAGPDMEAATGLQYGANLAAGDFVTTTNTGFTPTTSLSWFCPVGVEFSYGVPVSVVGDVGDSLMRGQESSTATNGWRSVSQRACLLKSGGIWQAATFAVTGQGHAASYLTGLEVATKLRPRYLCFRAWSPNDGSPTQALIDAAWARTLALVEHCRRLNVLPVLCTTPPRNTLTAGEDAFLKVQNARIKALSGWVLVSDEAAVVEDPADRSKLLAAYNSGDGLHITSAAYNAMAVVRAVALAYY